MMGFFLHFRLRDFENAHSLQSHLETHLDRYKAQYGVLLFLYSVILTKVRFTIYVLNLFILVSYNLYWC